MNAYWKRAAQTAEDVAAAYHYGHLSALLHCLVHLLGIRRQTLRVYAVTPGAHKRFSRKLE